METKWLYGVSHGNGNDGVSHMYANYYVMTDQPYRLAELACLGEMKESAWDLVQPEIWVDGEADYTISATVLDPPGEEGEMDDGGSWSDANGAWHITEVFPEDEPRDGAPIYDSLEEAFSPELLARVVAE